MRPGHVPYDEPGLLDRGQQIADTFNDQNYAYSEYGSDMYRSTTGDQPWVQIRNGEINNSGFNNYKGEDLTSDQDG